MKLEGFIGPAYTLDSLNVDAQRCVNLYPELIESGKGKEGQVAYLRGTPGLELFEEIGDGPIRCIHVDSIGRVFVVSGAKIYSVSQESQWRLQFTPTLPAVASYTTSSVNTTADTITVTDHGYPTGLKVQFNAEAGGMQGGIPSATDFYIIRDTADTIKVATSLENARAGTAVNITSQGVTGPFSITPQAYSALYNVEYDGINFSANSFTKDDHGYIDGLAVSFKATAQYPTGVLPDTTYYITQSSVNTFKLASSFANALAGTAISFSQPSSETFVKQMGSDGEYGGSTVTLATSTGTVKAASMSAGGNGTDSSTIFVDGASNYLLEDFEGNQALGVLGATNFAQAIIDITSDITITTLGDIDEHVLSDGLTVSDEATYDVTKIGNPTGNPTIGIALYKDVVNATGETSYKLNVARSAWGFARAVIDITNDIEIQRHELSYSGDESDEVDEHVNSSGITIRNFETTFGAGFENFVIVDFYKDTNNKNGSLYYYRIDIYHHPGVTLTTAELVTGLSTGAIAGRSLIFTSNSSPSSSYIRTQMDQTNYEFYGGGSQTTLAAFGTPVSAVFTKEMETATTLTTAELVEILSTGELSGKTLYVSNGGTAPAGTTRTQLPISNYTFSGGGSQQTSSAFGTPVQADWTREVSAGQGFGSVPTATHIVWSDGYFIVNEGGTNKFFVSGLQDFEINTLDFSSSEGSPDIVLALAVLNRYLYILNEKTTEVYANTGNADFPFERIQGGFIEVGIFAKYSLAKTGNSFCWLGRQQDGAGVVFIMNGTQPQRISTHAIEQAIGSYADPSSATAFSYQYNGHTFYVLNFAEATWVYDLSTQMWHERAYLNAGELERHRAEACAYVPSQRIHLVGDYETNEVYILKEDVYSDDGDEILRMRTSPHISADGNRIHYSRFQLDMETGIGLDGDVQGSSPTVMLDWSNDGGHTWSSEQYALADAGAGEIGDYKKRVIWRRLGQARDRIFRVKITDPVKVRLINAMIDVEARSS